MDELYALKAKYIQLSKTKGNMEDCAEKTAYQAAFRAWQQNIEDYEKTDCYKNGYDTPAVWEWRASFRDAHEAAYEAWMIVRLGEDDGRAYKVILDELKSILR
jgi:hypothetical protein